MQSNTTITNEGILNLIEAIIKGAITDYKSIIYRNNHGITFSLKQYEELREFFMSEYFVDLTGIESGDKIVEHFDSQLTRPLPKRNYYKSWSEDKLKQLVQLRDSGLTFPEIGDILDTSAKSAYTRYRRYVREGR